MTKLFSLCLLSLLASCGGTHGLAATSDASPGPGSGADATPNASPDAGSDMGADAVAFEGSDAAADVARQGPDAGDDIASDTSDAGDDIVSEGLDARADAPSSQGPDADEDAPISPNLDAPTVDNRPASTIVGDCTSDVDCLLVLDYRAGFGCYRPVGASRADVSRDHCLLPWAWTTGMPAWCDTAPTPADCPGGNIPGPFSCPVASCMVATCDGGKCMSRFAIGSDGVCTIPTPSPPPVDCKTLRANYFTALAVAQECDPTKQPTTCLVPPGIYKDSCGCPAAVDSTNLRSNALSCAQSALDNGNCGYGNCGSPCPTGNQAAVCVPNSTGTMGTCTMQ